MKLKRAILILLVLIVALALISYDAGGLTSLGVFLLMWANNMDQKLTQ